MSNTKINHGFTRSNLLNIGTILLLLFLSAGVTAAGAEKTPTNLTITITPDNPGIGDTYTVTGVLSTAEGKGMGNKRVSLQFSVTTDDDDDAFEILETRVTDRDGAFRFFRAETANPEFVRLIYTGNDQYAPATSQAVSIRGAGTDHPLVDSTRTGSIKVSTNPQGAEIFVDEILKGVTPLTVIDLPEGTHSLTLVKKGYQNETTEVFVTSKINNSFDVTLKKEE